MQAEDHPIAYNRFEGAIPTGEYGGGTVRLWDRGDYEAEDGGGAALLRRGYEEGELRNVLRGQRQKGGWIVVQIQRRGRPQWLLIKHRDETSHPDVDVTARHTTSVATKRTMAQISSAARS